VASNIYRKRALWCYLASVLVLVLGSIVAARHYPGGFDWAYMVASSLASQKDNPDGHVWYAGALGMAMVLLWPYISAIKNTFSPTRPRLEIFAVGALRIGLICGFLVSLEGLFIRDLAHWIHKGHEIIATIAFLGLFTGVFSLLIQAMLQQRIYVFPALLVAAPLLAIAITQVWLYLQQRDIGWVGTNWRQMGIPFWLSFPFWQWLAMVFLETGLGLLAFLRTDTDEAGTHTSRTSL
jgi:hypothetical protein